MDRYIKNFWETGNGKELIKWSGAQITLDGLDHMEHLSAEYDILGDDAATDIFKGRSFGDAYSYISNPKKKSLGFSICGNV